MPRRLVTLITLALSMVIIFALPVEAARRATGNGNTLRFSAGERVAGEIISIRNSDGTWGRTWYRCKLSKASRSGRVTSGVINYFMAEVRNLPNCKDTLSSPTPRQTTGSGNWRPFKTGYHVLGFAIETNGRTYIKCGMTSVSHNGRVVSGVVNPSRFELGAIKRCNSTTNWRPGYRKTSGDGSLSFKEGDYVLAAFIRLNNGQEYNGSGNGCHMVAPMSGTLFGGVRNYWPGEAKDLPHC